ncbi:hypothetical protein ACIBLA_21425 [Streptomyces sp. NPDC050433]|uniref:hypothetical protein n=1 Tax=Streptomyces sp. NPDC050433 TaxID=3365615 RepID=UPI0037A2E25B
MKIRTFVATASLVPSGSLVAFSGSAQAALHTTCVGDGAAVTVSNDLAVPAGKSCTLTGTRVKGSVTVESGATEGFVYAGASYFGGNPAVTDNTANAVLDNAIVRGSLTATGNNPVLVVGELARVRGAVTGETAGPSSAGSAKKAAPQDRGAALAEKAAERAAAARADAHEAGRSSL